MHDGCIDRVWRALDVLAAADRTPELVLNATVRKWAKTINNAVRPIIGRLAMLSTQKKFDIIRHAWNSGIETGNTENANMVYLRFNLINDDVYTSLHVSGLWPVVGNPGTMESLLSSGRPRAPRGLSVPRRRHFLTLWVSAI